MNKLLDCIGWTGLIAGKVIGITVMLFVGWMLLYPHTWASLLTHLHLITHAALIRNVLVVILLINLLIFACFVGSILLQSLRQNKKDRAQFGDVDL
jgi:hypothetical protein